ncbi:Type II secretion system protein E [compost metagenome]
MDHALLPSEHEWLRQELGDKVDGHRYRRGKGCTHCNGTGYLGRTGIYEVLEMAGPVVEAANENDVRQFIRVAREQMGGNSLRRHAAQLVAAGVTTAEEAMRVSNQFEE